MLPCLLCLVRYAGNLDTKKRTVQTDDQFHAAYPDIRRDWKAVLDRFARGPVVISYIPPGMDTYDAVTMEGLAEAIHQMMFESETYAQIPLLLHTLATNEDWTPIVKDYNE